MSPSFILLCARLLPHHRAPVSATVELARTTVARLGGELGRPVGIERSLGAVPVFVDAPELSPAASLRALASALRASVIEDGTSLRIERTAADRKAVRATHSAANRARVAAGLASWDRILRRADKLGDAAAQVRAAHAEVAQARHEADVAADAHRAHAVPNGLMGESMVTPAGRLLYGLLTRVGPNALAQLAPSEIRFSSNRPNAAESTLSPCDDLVAAYATAQEGYAAAMGLPVPAAPAKVILRSNEIGADLEIYDALGKLLDNGWMSFQMGVFYPGSPIPSASISPRWIERNDASRRLASVLAVSGEPLRPEDLPDTYLHPERFDPLAFDVGAAIQALPREKGAAALVAALSDDLLRPAEDSLREDRMDVAAFAWRTIGEGGAYERVQVAGATVVRPKDALAAEAQLVDREALGRELRRVVADRDLTRRSLCLLHASLYTSYSESAVVDRYLYPLDRLGFGRPRTETGNRGAMALNGTALRANIAEADANAPTFAWIVRDGISNGWLKFQKPPGASDLDVAPSSVLAALAKARIACERTESPIVMPIGNVGEAEMRKAGFSGWTPERVGEFPMLAYAHMPASFLNEKRKQALIDGAFSSMRFVLGRRQSFTVEVRLTSGLRAHLEFPEDVADRWNLTLADLPPAMQEAILRSARNTLDNPPPGIHPPDPDDKSPFEP